MATFYVVGIFERNFHLDDLLNITKNKRNSKIHFRNKPKEHGFEGVCERWESESHNNGYWVDLWWVSRRPEVRISYCFFSMLQVYEPK